MTCFNIPVLCTLLFIGAGSATSYAQLKEDAFWNDKEGDVVRIHKHTPSFRTKTDSVNGMPGKWVVLEGGLHSDGWGMGMQGGYQLSARGYQGWEWSVNRMFHEKEIKQSNSSDLFKDLGKPGEYVYGKINDAFSIRLGYNRNIVLLPAFLDGKTDLYLHVSAGASVGLLKPYYLKLAQFSYDSAGTAVQQVITEKYNSRNAASFLDRSRIFGAASWSRGLSEIQYVPGLYASAGIYMLSFGPGSVIKGWGMGASAAFYSKALSVMAMQQAHNYQCHLWIKIFLGKAV